MELSGGINEVGVSVGVAVFAEGMDEINYE